jgi:hypothetical protein
MNKVSYRLDREKGNQGDLSTCSLIFLSTKNYYRLEKNKVEEQNPLKKTDGSFPLKAIRIVEVNNGNQQTYLKTI